MKLPRRLRPGEEATLVEHLDELRTRLIIAIGSIVACTIVAFIFREHIIELLQRPLPDHKEKTITFGVAEPFFTSLRVSLYAGLAAALPIVLWQLWSFLAPAMEEGAQRIVVVFVLIATVLFAGGLLVGYYFVLPSAISFLTDFDSDLYNIQVRARDYFSFVSLALLAVGLVAELPVFILALVRLRVLTATRLRRNRRMGYVIMAVLAVVLPGVDPMTTLMLSVLLGVLFEGTIWVAVFFERRWERVEPELAPSEL